MIKISFDISLFRCLCITSTRNCFPFPPTVKKPSLRIYYVLFWCVQFLKKITKKPKKKKQELSYILFKASFPHSVSVQERVAVWVCLWLHAHRDRGRCSDSMREVHSCVMKPIITGWEMVIVHAIDKSLSVTSAVFCQRLVFLYPTPPTAMHPLPLRDNTKASLSWTSSVLGDNGWFAFNSLMCQAPLYYSRAPGAIYIVSLSGAIMLCKRSVWHLPSWYGSDAVSRCTCVLPQ